MPENPPSDDQDPSHRAHFDVDASVIYQLGEHLISDVVQALVELVKNAYDADATYAQITIDTKESAPGSRYPESIGHIIVEDDGVGMDERIVRDHWLRISNSAKRDAKRRGETTARGRTPLGDKGLGRLGVQRLGDHVEMYSRREIQAATKTTPAKYAPDTLYVAFSWSQFVDKVLLSDVKVILRPSPKSPRKRGTAIVISDLRDMGTWRGEGASKRIKEGLSQLLSPYEIVKDFRVIVSLDGQRLDLAVVGTEIRRAARVHYDFEFDGDHTWSVTGHAKLAFFQPPSGRKLNEFRELTEKDKGAAFRDFLLKHPKAATIGLEADHQDGWFIKFGEGKDTDQDVDKVRLIRTDGRMVLANPGSFRGEVDYFDLGRQTMAEQKAFDSATDFKEYIKTFSGIRVYRDGFGIRVDRDWLGLSEQSTSGKSYYGLRPSNTLGYVAISGRQNPELQEKTDREGFQRTPYYDNFELLLEGFVGFTAKAQGLLRRAWSEYVRTQAPRLAQLPADTSPEHVARFIRQRLAEAAQYREPLLQLNSDLRATLDGMHADLEVVGRSPTLKKVGDQAFLEAAVRARRQAAAAQQRVVAAQPLFDGVTGYLHDIAQLDPAGELLTVQIEELRERMAEVYELVSLGVTAELLSHEIVNIANALDERTTRARAHAKRHDLLDDKIAAYFEYVQASVRGLRKQIGHLAPALRYAREKRDVIRLSAFLTDIAAYYEERLSADRIEVVLAIEDDFTVTMGRGKLTQVIDNLILNAEHWVKEALRREQIEQGRITITVAKPHVRVSDNGPGVAPRLEEALFDAFVTGKSGGQGRGLGLYVARQMLAADECTIDLAPERNDRGRRYIFDLDLSGTIQDG